MVKKIFIGVGVFFILLIGTVILIPIIFKDKINEKVKAEINDKLNAKVDYGDFDISLIKSFPNFSFSLNNLSVVGVDSFKGDTLAFIKNFNFTIDLMSVINGGQYKILALNIIEPDVNAIVNYDGKPNWDIVKPTPPSAPSAGGGGGNFSLQIKKYKIEKGNITYEDKKGGTLLDVGTLNFEGSGDVTKDVYDFSTKTSIDALTYKSGAIAYLNKAKLNATINLAVENAANKYTFKENSISLNDLGLQFDGYVAMPKDAMNMDINFKSKETQFKSILSLIPAVYKKDFDKVKTSGSLALNGKVKGAYSKDNYPAINLNLKVDNGMFQYPSLPVAVRNIFIAADVAKPQGSLDLMVVNVPKLHVEAGSDPVDATINVKTPISDPNILADVKGHVDLSNVPKYYPVEGMKSLTGVLTANVNFNGKKSDVDKKNYKDIKAGGLIQVSNLVYDSKDIPMPVKVNDMKMTFNPQNVTLDNLAVVIGKSDITANGKLENFMAYLFNQGDLSGNLNLKSNVFDANEWLQKDKNAPATSSKTAAAAKPDTAKTQYFKVPAHIDFTANSTFGKIYYEKMVLESVKGVVSIKDEAINLENLSANLLGGSAKITAKYNTKHTDHPDVTFSYVISNFDFQQTYQAVGMSAKMAPVIQYVHGNFSSDLKGSGRLKPDMSVDYNSLVGDGKVQIPSAKISDLPLLNEVNKLGKIPALQNLELKNAYTVIKFKDGRVAVDPTDFKFGNGYNVNVSGSNGFDQTIDYDFRIDVPTKELGQAATAAQGLLSQIPGLGASLPATISLTFKATGTANKPTVKLLKMGAGGKGGGGSIADDLKKKAENEAKQKADELKKQAEQQAADAAAKAKQAAQQAAQQQADQAKKNAQQQADKLKQDAEKNAKDLLKWPK